MNSGIWLLAEGRVCIEYAIADLDNENIGVFVSSVEDTLAYFRRCDNAPDVPPGDWVIEFRYSTMSELLNRAEWDVDNLDDYTRVPGSLDPSTVRAVAYGTFWDDVTLPEGWEWEREPVAILDESSDPN